MPERDRFITIRHPETGEGYAVRPADFHRLYEPRGFEAGDYEDGAPYEPPKRRKPGAGDGDGGR